jgi:hypothetical protein
MKVRDRQVDAGVRERALSSAGGKGIPGTIVVDVGRIMKGACHSFARAVDWQHRSHIVSHNGDRGLEELGAGYKLSENHEGLHSGRYISVRVLQAANALAVKGGYYDRYWQPKTVYRESVPLREVTAQGLGRLLMEMHDRLRRHSQAEAT